MPRSPRRELPPGLLHVTCRTIRRAPLFLGAHDARTLLNLLDGATRAVPECAVHAYCLMPNHVHYVVDSELDALSHVMHQVNGSYAQRFNRSYGFRGHLFQGRFHAKPIADEPHLLHSIRYVVLNPVRAGFCERPEQWRWSSYRALLGLDPPRRLLALDRTLALWGGGPKARAAIRRFVDEELPAAFDRGQSRGLSPVPDGRAAQPKP